MGDKFSWIQAYHRLRRNIRTQVLCGSIWQISLVFGTVEWWKVKDDQDDLYGDGLTTF